MIVSGVLNSGCERSGGLVRETGQKRLSCRPAIFTKKLQKSREIINFTAFCGGPNRDRTDDLTDAKRQIKLFCIISNYLWQFPLSFSFFPPLFRTLISMCYAAVCGVSCGQKRSPPFAGNGFPAWTGSIFRASNCLHCNSEGRIQQVISAPSRTQKLGGCKQKRYLASKD